MFGANGKIGAFIKAESEFTYRHAFPRNGSSEDIPRENLSGEAHPSYYKDGGTRFFGPKVSYPD